MMQVNEKTSTKQSRNQMALDIFTRNGFAVKLKGSDDSPMFILEDRLLISCFVNGNSLYFRTSPDSGEISRSIRLNGDAFITKYEISELIEKSEHLPVYRIQDIKTQMYLVGYNYFESRESFSDERYPVFANHNPYIYLNPSKVEMEIKELNENGYNVKII